MRNRLLSIFAIFFFALTGCEDDATDLPGSPGSPERLVAEGLQKLSKAEYEAAEADFQAVLDADTGFVCEAHYGMALAGIQDVAARIDTVVDSAAVFLGATPGLAPAQANLSAVVEEILEPFEEYFAEIVAELSYVIDNNCSVSLPEGYPLEAGDPNSVIYFKTVLGYQFDVAAAELIRVIYAGLLGSTQFLLAHDLAVNVGSLDETLDVIVDAFTSTPHVDVYDGGLTIPTIIPALRSLGIVASEHPRLLALRDEDRFAEVDNSYGLMFQSIYMQHDGGDHGILPAAAAAAANDDDVTDNMLGLIDADGNGYVNEGDSIVIGIREIHLTGLLSEPSLPEGIVIHLNSSIGDVDDILAAVYEIVQNLGTQFAAVDGFDHHGESVESYDRLGVGPINDILSSITLTNLLLEPIPEAIELDIAAYFKTPIGVRDLFPIWYDDDGDPDTHAVFLIEGEAWVTSPEEQEFVKLGDSAHFTGTYTFDPEFANTGAHAHDHGDTDFVSLGELDDLTIPADGVAPLYEAVALPIPLVYSALQSPSFNGVLYVDLAKLYGSPETGGTFELADSYSVNKTLNDYVKFFVTSWFHL